MKKYWFIFSDNDLYVFPYIFFIILNRFIFHASLYKAGLGPNCWVVFLNVLASSHLVSEYVAYKNSIQTLTQNKLPVKIWRLFTSGRTLKKSINQDAKEPHPTWHAKFSRRDYFSVLILFILIFSSGKIISHLNQGGFQVLRYLYLLGVCWWAANKLNDLLTFFTSILIKFLKKILKS